MLKNSKNESHLGKVNYGMANRNSEVPSSEGERGRYISIITPKGVYLHHTIKDKGKNSAIVEKHCTTEYISSFHK